MLSDSHEHATFLDALALAKEGESSAHIGIITHEHLCDEQTIATLVGCPVSVFQVTDQNDVRAGVDQLTRAGCSVLVGGLTMCRLCEERGLKFVHIKTGYQAVVHAVAEAVAAARSLDRAQTRGNLLLTLLNNATYALLAIDSNGKIIAGN